jgi:predicted MFS family arabinose efflux permease
VRRPGSGHVPWVLAQLPVAGGRWVIERLNAAVGGPARRRVVVLLACVLGLQTADQGNIGAIAKQLEAALHVNNAELGLLASVTSLVGALFAIPLGVLTDRIRRVPLLSISIATWAVAMLASAFAGSYLQLLLTRLFLGAVTATAGPAVASLAGDFFPTRERGRLYGMVLAGELIGAGFGFLVSGLVGAALSWRFAMGLLAVPAVVLAVLLWRLLPEPARGGQSWVPPGADEIKSVEEVGDEPPVAVQPGRRSDALAQRLVREQGVEAEQELVVDEDLEELPLRQAVAYVLKVKTNLLLILASALGYFFFAGLRTFAVVFVEGQYRFGQGVASTLLLPIGAAALLGVLVGGRLADRMMRRGRIDARPFVAGIAYIASAIAFIPGFLTRSLLVALPVFLVAAALLGAPNPPLDAARLDIMPPRLWGRAEAIRTVLRTVAEAIAPIVFGLIADQLGTAPSGGRPSGVGGFTGGGHSGSGLGFTFLVMLIPLGVSGYLMLRSRRYYPTDVATAVATEKASERAR